jgi:hypothetical protein
MQTHPAPLLFARANSNHFLGFRCTTALFDLGIFFGPGLPLMLMRNLRYQVHLYVTRLDVERNYDFVYVDECSDQACSTFTTISSLTGYAAPSAPIVSQVNAGKTNNEFPR